MKNKLRGEMEETWRNTHMKAMINGDKGDDVNSSLQCEWVRSWETESLHKSEFVSDWLKKGFTLAVSFVNLWTFYIIQQNNWLFLPLKKKKKRMKKKKLF